MLAIEINLQLFIIIFYIFKKFQKSVKNIIIKLINELTKCLFTAITKQQLNSLSYHNTYL